MFSATRLSPSGFSFIFSHSQRCLIDSFLRLMFRHTPLSRRHCCFHASLPLFHEAFANIRRASTARRRFFSSPFHSTPLQPIRHIDITAMLRYFRQLSFFGMLYFCTSMMPPYAIAAEQPPPFSASQRVGFRR